MPEIEEFYTVSEVADILKVSWKTIVRMIHNGHFPGAYRIDPLKPRSPYRIPKSDVSDFIEKYRKGSSAN